MDSGALPVGRWEQDDRARRLADELRFALGNVPKKSILKCILMTPGYAYGGVKHRLSKAATIARRLIVSTDDFFVEGFRSIRSGDMRGFAERSWDSGSAAIKTTATASRAVALGIPRWLRDIRSCPAETLPEVVGTTLGFLIGSGGLYANGGLPDLDLVAGIGNHRSFLTHSILMGAAAEAILIALDEVVLLTYQHLPLEHDPLWDSLHRQFKRTTKMAKVGVGLGIAYHLGVDGSIQVAAYKDLPVSMPMKAHQALFEMNAGVEAMHAYSKSNQDSTETSKDERIKDEPC